MARKSLQKTSQSRVFTIEDRAGPNHTPRYQSLARPTAVSWGQGDVTPIRTPDPKQYGRYITIDTIRGQQDLPGLGLEFRMTRDASEVLKLVRKGCDFDLQVHIGSCKDPSDFDAGWEKIQVLEGAKITNYSTDDLGAFDADGEQPVTESIDLVGDDFYEILPIAFTEKGASAIVQEVIGVAICDARSCGECGLPSDGCQRIFAVTVSAGGSPGLPAEVIYTADGGDTVSDTVVTSLGVSEDPVGLACVGPNLAIISNDSNSVHYASIVDILNGEESWTEQATGFVVSKAPNAIASTGRTNTWIAGDGGYIYFADDIEVGVTAQTAGDVTSENLLAIAALDEESLIAGGENNALLVTRNGGSVWTAVAAPSAQAAVNITAVAMLSDTEWIIGYSDGAVYFTADSGQNWGARALPGSITAVTDIRFSTRTVGYLTGTVAGGAGRVLRTISGGNSWYILPETAGLTIPVNTGFNSIAACGDDPNQVWVGGSAANGTDGILLKGG